MKRSNKKFVLAFGQVTHIIDHKMFFILANFYYFIAVKLRNKNAFSSY